MHVTNMPHTKVIQVTEPFLPPFEDYVRRLQGIWERKLLTNDGPLVQELEQKLQTYHGLGRPARCLANGALGLQIALKALGVAGEIITSPFSYVATASCPLWEGCRLVFADIEPDSLTLDPQAIEAAITPSTEAIVAPHVFGNPCDVEAIAAIAAKRGLAVIYDAAHAFGVDFQGRSILEWGDVSMVSLHATKLFHSVEGGFVVAQTAEVDAKLEWMRRFGHNGPGDFHGVGINAKMSELHAAMGLCVFEHLDTILRLRRSRSEDYDVRLADCPGLADGLAWRRGASRNYAYYSVLFESERMLLRAVDRLHRGSVFPRRYFYPSLDTVASLGSWGACPVSQDVSSRVLCLPLSTYMVEDDVDRVCELSRG